MTYSYISDDIYIYIYMYICASDAAEDAGVSPIVSADVIWLLAFCISGTINCVYAGVRERDCVCR